MTKQPLASRILILAICLGTVYSGPQAAEFWVARFSMAQPGPPTAPWGPRLFPKVKRHTHYELVAIDGKTVLKAESSASASALATRVTVDPHRFPYLEWSWRIQGIIPDAKWKDKKADDFSARLFVIFSEPKGFFSPFRKLITKIADGLPGRSLNYVWANAGNSQVFAPSPYTDHVVMIAVESGKPGIMTWKTERRNVVEDYRKAFGKQPGKIIAVALMTDTDNTQSSSVAYYGDILFKSN